MISVAVLALLLCLVAHAEADCAQGCEKYCGTSNDNVDCQIKCQASCTTPLVAPDHWIELLEVANLYQDFPLTGCAGYHEPPRPYLFCTSLGDRVYRIDMSDNKISVYHSMDTSRLYTEDSCGLYNIVLDVDFHTNSRIFLYHAMPDSRENIHHVNVISEYRVVDDAMVFKRVVRVFVHREPVRHGWADMEMRHYITTGPARFLVSNPGNPYNNRTLRATMPHLSAISAFYLNETEAATGFVFAGTKKEKTIARGIGNPIDCARTRWLSETVGCLTTVGEQTLVYEGRRTEYSCQGEVCADHIKANLTGGCPIESFAYYTGPESLKPTRLLSRSACYLDGAFHPAEILKLHEHNYELTWTSSPIRTSSHDGKTLALTNTKILTADGYKRVYIGGYSLRDNSYRVYGFRIVKNLF